MKIQLTDQCTELTITTNTCSNSTASDGIHPDNTRTLFPNNPRNPYDWVGAMHNEAVLYSYSREQPGDSTKAVLAYIDEYFEHAGKLPKLPFGKKKPPPHHDDGSTIFYPPIPDEVLSGACAKLVQSSQTFNPATDRYQDLYRQAYIFEDHVMLLAMDKELQAHLLMMASAIRHCHALWLGVGQEIDPGVMASTTPITDADIAALTQAPSNWSENRKLRSMSRASRKKARELRKDARKLNG